MSSRNFIILTIISLMVFVGVMQGCDEDTSYDSRTVVYVSNINDGAPYFSDVLNQGDSLRRENGDIVDIDDYIEEDWIKVTIHNRPYSSIANPAVSSLGDFLLTDYEVRFTTQGGATNPVPTFTGETSILVPSNSTVEAFILLVPFNAKTVDPLFAMRYTDLEILASANITFRGHEVQTDRDIEFNASISVNFADFLGTEDMNED